MVFVLGILAAIWGLGHLFGATTALRWKLTGLLYLVIMGLQLILPAASGLRGALGGSPGEWAILGVAALVIWGYRVALGYLKARATPTVSNTPGATFSPTELERYARHIVLREIGGPGQKRLKNARVLVVGAGGLGSPALLYLAAAGVGTIGVIDDDVVDNSNLQRQVIHTDGRIDMPKVLSAKAAMLAQNPHVNVQTYNRRLGPQDAADLIGSYDIVLDGTDNFDTRYLINRTCVALKKPLIAAALTQWEGQISTYDPAQGAPCYCCIFPKAPADGLAPSCAQAGVLGPLPGVLGAMMAVEAVKEIAKAGEGLRGRLMIYDALYADTRVIKLKPRPNCEVCGNAP